MNGLGTSVIHAVDALIWMKEQPDHCIDAIITDPVWPDTQLSSALLPSGTDALELFTAFSHQAARLTNRLVIVLGCDSDPRFLRVIPTCLPFVRIVHLERVPGSYRGPIYYDADVAYIFGSRRLNGSSRVMPGKTVARVQDTRTDHPHPCPRNLRHMRYLVHHFTRPGDLIVDPFAGSGTVCLAAAQLGRNAIGLEINAGWAAQAQKRIDRTLATGPVDAFDVGYRMPGRKTRPETLNLLCSENTNLDQE